MWGPPLFPFLSSSSSIMVARSICSYCLPSSSLLYALEAVAFPSGHGRQRPEHGRGDSSSRRVARTAAAASTQLARELWRPHADGGCSDDDERGARTTAAGPRARGLCKRSAPDVATSSLALPFFFSSTRRHLLTWLGYKTS